MNTKKYLKILVIFIIVAALIATSVGIFSGTFSNSQNIGEKAISVNNQTVELYGKGVYSHDSISIASQAIAQDIVTLIIGIPLLIVSLILSRKSIKGKFLLTGTLGYFLYTYTSYSFLAIYNYLFLLYVFLMSASLYAFILSIISILSNYKLKECFNDKFNYKFVGGVVLFMVVFLSLLWLGKIVPPLLSNQIPSGLEHYTTLVIQGLDLGIIIPFSLIAGILTIKRNPIGYFLSSIVVIKGITLLSALVVMIIMMILNGVNVSIMEVVIFPIFTLLFVYCFITIMKSIKEPNSIK